MKILKRTRQLAVTSLAVLALLLISSSWTLADTSPSSEEWSSTFGGSDEDFGQSVQETRDGGYIVTGSTLSFGAGRTDVYLVKVGPQGSEEWSSTFGGAYDDRGWSVQETSDGGYIIAGETNSSGAGGTDVYLLKVDSQGSEEWSRTFGGSEDDVGYSVQLTSDGGYIIAGFTYSSGAGGTDVYLLKVDSQGSEEWSSTLGGSEDDYGWTVQETRDGGYIVTGSTLSFGAGMTDVYLVKVDSQGSEEWSRTLGGSEDDFGYSVRETSDGGYIIAGFTMSFGAGAGDVYLVKVDSQGSEEWNRTFGDTDVEFGVSVQSTSDGGFIIAGFTYSFVTSKYDLYLVKTDPQGNKEWSSTLGGSDDEWGQSVQETRDGGYIIAGSTRSYGAGLWDVYLVKTDSKGRDEETYTASIVSLKGPLEVNAGESFTVELTVTYEFTVPTEMSPGVYDVETQKFLAEEYETLEGEGTKTYSFELTAPEEETTWALAAGVWYHSGGELLHDEVDWVESFDIQVKKSNQNVGIPGFPVEAIIFGLLIGFYFLSRRASLQS